AARLPEDWPPLLGATGRGGRQPVSADRRLSAHFWHGVVQFRSLQKRGPARWGGWLPRLVSLGWLSREGSGMVKWGLLALAVGVVCLPAFVGAGEWPQFRGPGGSAVSEEKQLPAEWGADKNVAWKAKLSGYGWSCPIVWGDKVFVTTAVSDKQKKPS